VPPPKPSYAGVSLYAKESPSTSIAPKFKVKGVFLQMVTVSFTPNLGQVLLPVGKAIVPGIL
jgi:hypothetical protein